MQKHINIAQMTNILYMNMSQNKDFFDVLAAIQLPNLEKFMQFGKQIIGKNPINLGLHCHKT